MTFLSTVFAATENAGHVDGFWFGLIAFAIFMALGAVVWSFRDVANRHAAKADAYAAAHGGGHQHGGH